MLSDKIKELRQKLNSANELNDENPIITFKHKDTTTRDYHDSGREFVPSKKLCDLFSRLFIAEMEAHLITLEKEFEKL